MGYLIWVVIGACAGFLATELMGAHEGKLLMIVLGVLGALAGGAVAANVFSVGSVDSITVSSIAIVVIGAVAMLLCFSALHNLRKALA